MCGRGTGRVVSQDRVLKVKVTIVSRAAHLMQEGTCKLHPQK